MTANDVMTLLVLLVPVAFCTGWYGGAATTREQARINAEARRRHPSHRPSTITR